MHLHMRHHKAIIIPILLRVVIVMEAKCAKCVEVAVFFILDFMQAIAIFVEVQAGALFAAVLARRQ